MKYWLSWWEQKDGKWEQKSKVISYIPEDVTELCAELSRDIASDSVSLKKEVLK